MDQALSVFLHLDQHLIQMVQAFGPWTYALLFLIMFLETGLIVVPFLPGDSLLFAAGATAAIGDMEVHLLALLLLIAAVLGDVVNYGLGAWIGPKIFHKEDSLFFKKKYLHQSYLFYKKYGGIAIILARFVPIVRSFAPFIAGIAQMQLRSFMLYNLLGGLIWVYSLTYLGYFFGNLPTVKSHFSEIIVAIVVISLIPMAISVLRGLWAKKHAIAKNDTDPS